MQVTVNRLLKTADNIICTVEVNGVLKYYGLQPVAFTFEGTFQLTKYNSPSHGFPVPLINNVPGHSGVEIHIGNKVVDTKGCLVLANDIVNNEFISNSTAAVHEFYKNFFAAIADKEKCTITFKNLFT